MSSCFFSPLTKYRTVIQNLISYISRALISIKFQNFQRRAGVSLRTIFGIHRNRNNWQRLPRPHTIRADATNYRVNGKTVPGPIASRTVGVFFKFLSLSFISFKITFSLCKTIYFTLNMFLKISWEKKIILTLLLQKSL